jgi:hypothetical protein
MPSEKTPASHNSEYIYKIPFIEHEMQMFRASRILRRIVMALIITNAAWITILAFIMSLKK